MLQSCRILINSKTRLAFLVFTELISPKPASLLLSAQQWPSPGLLEPGPCFSSCHVLWAEQCGASHCYCNRSCNQGNYCPSLTKRLKQWLLKLWLSWRSDNFQISSHGWGHCHHLPTTGGGCRAHHEPQCSDGTETSGQCCISIPNISWLVMLF